ncbi:MAG: helix-turn-helix transcriptional regulator [Bacteriovoracaceae bacterium]
MKNAKDVIKRKVKKESAGDILKRYRESFELSQAALAELIGTTQNNISAIENGKRDIGVNVAIKLCAVFPVTLEKLLVPGGLKNHPDYKKALKRAS